MTIHEALRALCQGNFNLCSGSKLLLRNAEVVETKKRMGKTK
jgi:hypothetical protein